MILKETQSTYIRPNPTMGFVNTLLLNYLLDTFFVDICQIHKVGYSTCNVALYTVTTVDLMGFHTEEANRTVTVLMVLL